MRHIVNHTIFSLRNKHQYHYANTPSAKTFEINPKRALYENGLVSNYYSDNFYNEMIICIQEKGHSDRLIATNGNDGVSRSEIAHFNNMMNGLQTEYYAHTTENFKTAMKGILRKYLGGEAYSLSQKSAEYVNSDAYKERKQKYLKAVADYE